MGDLSRQRLLSEINYQSIFLKIKYQNFIGMSYLSKYLADRNGSRHLSNHYRNILKIWVYKEYISKENNALVFILKSVTPMYLWIYHKHKYIEINLEIRGPYKIELNFTYMWQFSVNKTYKLVLDFYMWVFLDLFKSCVV